MGRVKTTKPLTLQGNVPSFCDSSVVNQLTYMHRFNMILDGTVSKVSHKDGNLQLDCPKEFEDDFRMLLDEAERLGDRVNALDDLEVAEFLYRYFKMKRKVIGTLRANMPLSKRIVYQVSYGAKTGIPGAVK